MRQMYKFGCFLRKRYGDFLGRYKHSEVHARTSDVNRTKMTLQVVLAGLYPPEGQLCWNSALNWAPIPYHYAAEKADVLFASHNSQM